MSRIRSIKPEFFLHEGLAELSPLHRLLFQGLWTLADKEGLQKDRPKRIKASVLPYDDCDVDSMLTDLNRCGFIVRYDGVAPGGGRERCICIPSFGEHQRPHPKESRFGLSKPDLSTASREIKLQGVEPPPPPPTTTSNNQQPPGLELKPTKPERPPRKRSEGQKFRDWAEAERVEATRTVEGPDPEPAGLNRWYADAVAKVGDQRLRKAFARYLLRPKDDYWVQRGFPFAGFMSEHVWRAYVPPTEEAA